MDEEIEYRGFDISLWSSLCDNVWWYVISQFGIVYTTEQKGCLNKEEALTYARLEVDFIIRCDSN